MMVFLQLAGLTISLGSLLIMIWSAALPARRLWPPTEYNAVTAATVWIPTITLCIIIAVLGLLGWSSLALPGWLRFGVGGALMILGNLGVWFEVSKFGLEKTGGAHDGLRTGGLYRFSRNPQYVADAAIVIGWWLVSASLPSLAVSLSTLALLMVAPLAEEPWLQEQYGEAYRTYRKRVRRYL